MIWVVGILVVAVTILGWGLFACLAWIADLNSKMERVLESGWFPEPREERQDEVQ